MQLKPTKPKVETYFAIEDEFDLANVVCVRRSGREMWGLMLSQGERKQFVFGLTLEGIHENQIDSSIVKNVRAGYKEITPNEKLTICSHSFADDTERQAELGRLADNCFNPKLRFFIFGEQYRVKELTTQGVRKHKQQFVFCTYTDDPATAKTTNWLEATIARGEDFWHKRFTGLGEEFDEQRLTNLLNNAYDVWLQRQQLLGTKMRLPVKPMSGEQLWQYLQHQLNGSQSRRGEAKQSIPLPHYLLLENRKLKWVHYRDQLNADKGCQFAVRPGEELHMTSLLVGEKLPVPAREWLYLPERGCYVGILSFDEPPEGWENDASQFRWLWDEVIAQEQVVNVEVVTQIGWVNSRNNLGTLQKYTRQHLGVKSTAEKKGNFDASANLESDEGKEAQISLLKGDISVYVGLAIVVYAQTQEALNSTISFLQNRFAKPAVLWRERDYPWRVWLQTLPLRWEALYLKPFDRRLKMRVSDATGFSQLVTTRSRSKKGVEFIAERGGTPVFIDFDDPFGNPRHLAIFGRTGSGKSCMAAAFIIYALVTGMTVTLLDFPKPNSSYTKLVEFLGGAEFDTGRHSNNLMEMVDLRGLPPQVQQERLQTFYKTIINVVTALVLDSRAYSESLPISEIESIIALGVTAFYADIEIQQAFEAARLGGIGSAAWQDTPTLVHLLNFFDKQRLNLTDSGSEFDRAINYIKLRLRHWLSSPFGQAIACPSTADTSNQLILFVAREVDEGEAAILGLSGYTAAMRRSLATPRSLFYCDEASVLLKFRGLAHSIGMFAATGRSNGLSLMLATQDPDTIAKCATAEQILQNITGRLIGRINQTAIKSYERWFGYSDEMIAENASDSFVPSLEELFSRWLVDDDGLLTACRYYPPYNLLGITVNNSRELKARAEFFDKYPDDVEALGRFSQYMATCKRSGKEL
jgi:hypothetical protein